MKPKPAQLLLFVFTLLLNACGGTESQIDDHMNKAQRFYEQGLFQQAGDEYQSALKLNADHVEANFEMGRTLEALQNWNNALAFYDKVLALDKTHIDARIKLAQFHLVSGNTQQARLEAETAIAHSPQDATALAFMGALALREKDLSTAREYAVKALESEKDNINAIILMSGVLLDENNVDGSISLLEKSIRTHKTDTRLKTVLAGVYAKQEDEERAVDIMNDMIASQPQVLAHRVRLAAIFTTLGNLDKAEEVLRQAIIDLEENPQANLVLVKFLSDHRSPDVALQELKQMAEKQKNNAMLQIALAQAHESIGDSEEAISILNVFLEANSENVPALTMRGQLFLKGRQAEVAILDFQQALTVQNNSISLLRLLARSQVINNQLEPAINTLGKAVEINPDDIAVREEYMKLFAAKQDVDGVMVQLDEILRIDPDNLGALQTLLQVQTVQKDWTAAEKLVNKIKAQYPDKPLGYYFAGKLKQSQNQIEESAGEFEKALELAPDSVQPLTELVKSYLALKLPDKALSILDKTVSQFDNHFIAHNLRGEVLLFQREVGAAQESFNKAMSIKPDWQLPYRNSANIYLLNQEETLAEMTYKEGIKNTGSAILLVTELGLLYQNQSRHDDAIQLYQQALGKDGSNKVIANNLAMLLIDYRGDDESLKQAEGLVQILVDVNNYSFLDTKGWLNYKLGHINKAIDDLKKASALRPDSSEIHYHLGMAYLKNNDKLQAKSELLKAVEKGDRFFGYDEAQKALSGL